MRDPDLNRLVAMKEMSSELSSNPTARSMFLREARITGQLEHPNIVPVYEFQVPDAEEDAYYIMRLLRGKTLAESIAECHQSSGRQPLRSRDLHHLLHIFLSICNAIAYAHARGILHLDLKPSNIMLGEFGEVFVLDWGLAVVFDPSGGVSTQEDTPESESPPHATRTRQVAGTPVYMAPEQLAGQPDLFGPATDVHGLGAILCEVLSGAPPHPLVDGSLPVAPTRATTLTLDPVQDTIQRREFKAPTSSRSGPRALWSICAKALATGPDDRYPDVGALAEDLRSWLADDPISVYRPTLRERLFRGVRKHRTLAAVLAVLAISLAAFGLNLFRLTMLERQDQLVLAVTSKVAASAEALQALQQFCSSDPHLNPATFQRYASTLLERHPELQSMEWLPWDRPPDPEYLQQHPLMHAIRSEDRSTAVRDIEAGVSFITSPPVRLGTDRAAHGAAILLFCPLLDDPASGDRPPGVYQGGMLGIYRIDTLLEATWPDRALRQLDVALYDVTDPKAPFLLWTGEPGADMGRMPDIPVQSIMPFSLVTRDVPVWDRTWRVVTRAKPGFLLYYPTSR